MKLHEVIDSNGSNRQKRRLGKGEGNGHGKTCGRGHKGSKSRSGYSIQPGFEGGQMPLFRKLPRRGFSNFKFHKGYAIVNLGDLGRLEDGVTEVDREVLVKAGLVRDNSMPLKVLGNGEIAAALTVKAAKFSASAKEKIEAAGGKAVEG
ncbi:MAG: 50S ribosomal protein L15 [Verrucomicrobiota bacterium]